MDLELNRIPGDRGSGCMWVPTVSKSDGDAIGEEASPLSLTTGLDFSNARIKL